MEAVSWLQVVYRHNQRIMYPFPLIRTTPCRLLSFLDVDNAVVLRHNIVRSLLFFWTCVRTFVRPLSVSWTIVRRVQVVSQPEKSFIVNLDVDRRDHIELS